MADSKRFIVDGRTFSPECKERKPPTGELVDHKKVELRRKIEAVADARELERLYGDINLDDGE